MKKLISCILLLALCLSFFAGCGESEDLDLAKAKELLYTMYKDSGVKTTVDYTVVSQIRVGTTTYPITWTADVAEDLVKITKDTSGMTLVDVNETPSADVNYTLTGTMTNAKGQSVTVGFNHLIPKALGYKEIVDQAYALEAGKTLDGVYTLKGVISTIDTPWSPDYKNITVTINVEGVEGKPIMCYRLKGDGADALKVGDTITVKGSLTNYNGTIEYAAGCELLNVVPGSGSTDTTPPATEPPVDGGKLSIADAIAMGAAKEHNTYTTEKYSVTGVITEVYNDMYGNMKITDGNGNILTIYGTYSADGSTRYDAMATKPVAGDTVTILGVVGQYNNVAQIKNGWITEHTPASGSSNTTPPATEPAPTTPPATEPAPTTPPATDGTQLSIADAIAMGAAKEHNTYTTEKYSVTGVITEVYNDMYGNMKITDGNGNILTIYGTYSADGATRYDSLATKPVAGDTVTILGIVGQYNNVAQIKNGWLVAHTPASGSTNTTPPATEPAPTNPSVNVPAGATVKFDFTVLTDTPSSGNGYGSLSDAAAALAAFNKACTNSGLVSVTATKAYSGNGTGGAFENTNGLLKLSSSKENGNVVLTFAEGSKIAKVEIKAHGWNDKETSSLVVNGSAAQTLVVTGTPSVLTFTLDGSSNVLTIEATKRAFIFELVVTFAK